MRPHTFNIYKPQYFSKNLCSNKFIWKYKNRTLYRDASDFWLRNDMKNKDRSPIVEKLQKHMKYFYDEETFYNSFKLSRQEFLQKIESAKDDKKLT